MQLQIMYINYYIGRNFNLRNKVQYKIYIITEGICLNYKGTPLLFSLNQATRLINGLCYERVRIPHTVLHINGTKTQGTPTYEHWYHNFSDSTFIGYARNYTIVPSNATALQELNIPLRKYETYEFHIEPTRKGYKREIKSFWNKWVCPKCRYKLEKGSCCCPQNPEVHAAWYQNYYYDFKSMILNHF